MARIEIPQSSWVNELMQFANQNKGKEIQIFVEEPNISKKKIGRNTLISIEGDCSGEFVKEFKIVIGDMEGEDPDNLFHYVHSPKSLVRIENDVKGTVDEMRILGADNIETIIKPVDELSK